MDRATFTEKARTRVVPVAIEALEGEEVYLSSLSIKERKKIERMSANGEAMKEIAKDDNFHSWLIATCLRTESGERIFNPDNKNDLAEINLIDSEVSDQIVKAIFEHSGLVKEVNEDEGKN